MGPPEQSPTEEAWSGEATSAEAPSAEAPSAEARSGEAQSGEALPASQRTEAPPSRLQRMLPAAAVIIGVWAVLPPYTGPDLNTESRVEVADHVVPGAVLLAVVVASVILVRRQSQPAMSLLVAGLTILLAGIWMTATHVPLMAQAFRNDPGDPSVGGALYHTVPGLVVAALGLVWTAAHWRQAS